VPVETKYPHVVLGEDGAPLIEGTRLKVVELVVQKMAYGWSPEELHFQHPELTLGQVHGALAYYWDHAAELDRDIAERLRRAEGLRAEVEREPPSFLAKPKARDLF